MASNGPLSSIPKPVMVIGGAVLTLIALIVLWPLVKFLAIVIGLIVIVGVVFLVASRGRNNRVE